MSAEPADLTEKRQRIDAQQRAAERADWANLYHIYERCVEISEKVWSAKLQDAQADQTALAEDMAAIPVPLFTPRDRQQFIKEVAATLLVSADRRNLSVRFPKEKPDAPEEPEAPSESGVEAASGTDEGSLDDEAGTLAELGPVEAPHVG